MKPQAENKDKQLCQKVTIRVSFLFFSLCLASADARKSRATIHMLQRSGHFTPPVTRTHHTERALSIDGLPDPFVCEPVRSLQEPPDEIPLEGDDLCPCTDVSEATTVNASTDMFQLGRDSTIYQNITTYGYGCLQHDLLTTDCVKSREAGEEMPQWCLNQWCWVHHSTCFLLNHKSTWYRDRAYSYATCRSPHVYAQNLRVAQLKGQKLKVGLNSNSAGWMG
jgi:hypothetical protein